MISVYFAGPAIFRRDVDSYAAELKGRCNEVGIVPLWPLDNDAGAGDRVAQAKRIREMNCEMIQRADAVVADISPFRGVNMDPGTAFEIGYAAAIGKPTILYTSDSRTLLERAAETLQLDETNGRPFDAEGMEVEHFGLVENLMIAGGVDVVCNNREEAIMAVLLLAD
jgi:nucleoside 2-deoxyribosyltransferase